MQTHGGATAAAVIEGTERYFLNRVRVDWNRNGLWNHALTELSEYCESVSVDRSLRGSAPEALFLIEGASEAELTVTIGGEYDGQSMASIFSRWNELSPLYDVRTVGASIFWEITVEMSNGVTHYRQFTGHVRTVSPDRETGSVTITALDYAEQTRKPVMLPPWAVSHEHMSFGEVNSQLCQSHWVIDSVLRLCDVGPTDKRPATRAELGIANDNPDGIQLYVTGNGSYLPTVGYLDNPNASTFPTDGQAMYGSAPRRHPNATADEPSQLGFAGLGLPLTSRAPSPSLPTDQGIIRYWSYDQDRIYAGDVHYLGFTLNTNGAGATAFQAIGEHVAMEVYIGMARSLEIRIANGQVWTRRFNHETTAFADSPRVNIPTGQANVDVVVQWDNTVSSGSRVYVRAGTNSTGYVSVGTPVTTGSSIGADQIKGRVSIGQALNMSDIAYATRNISNSVTNDTQQLYRTPRYRAAIDRGLNRFTHMPPLQSRDAWSVITDVAAAEFGSVFFDENGVFRFWNQDTISAKKHAPVRDIHIDQVSGLTVTESLDSVRNIYSIQTNRKHAVMTGAVYRSSDVNEFYVPGQSTRTFRLFRTDIESPLTFFMGKHTSENFPDLPQWPVFSNDTPHGYCVQYLRQPDNYWVEMNGRQGVDIRVYFTGEGELTVRIYNGWTEPIRLARGEAENSQPAFHFQGTLINTEDTVSVITQDDTSIQSYGPFNIELSGDWYQDTYGYDLSRMLLDRTVEPIPATDAITIAGDPRLQLGDGVNIVDPEGFGRYIRFQIYGINRTLSRDRGLVDVLTVEAVPLDLDFFGEPVFLNPPSDEPSIPVFFNYVPNPSLGANATGYGNGTRVTGLTGFERATGYQGAAGAFLTGPRFDVTPGVELTYSFSGRVPTSALVQMFVDYYDSTGAVLNGGASNFEFSATLAANTVQRLDSGPRVIPEGAAQARIVAHCATAVLTATMYRAAESVDPDAELYRDGDSDGWSWNGERHNSSSTSGDPVVVDPARIQRVGNALYRGDQEWWFLGYNSFSWSGNCGSTAERMTIQQVDDWFASMRHDGHGVARLHFFRGWGYDRLDAAVASAKAHNIYLLITIDDAIAHCGEDFKDEAWFASPIMRADYIANFEQILERYRGESQILALEYFNEPGADRSDLGRQGASAATIRAFYDDMDVVRKAIDPDRLMSSGTLAPYVFGASQTGRDAWQLIHESPGVDIVSLHEYDQGEVVSNHAAGAMQYGAGKPLIVGEFGINANETGTACYTSFAGRASQFALKAQAYVDLPGCSGAIAWAWQPGSAYDACGYGTLDKDTATQGHLRTISSTNKNGTL